MIILYILIAFLGSTVLSAVDKEDGIFINICMQLAGAFMLVLGIRLALYTLS